jgi:phage-related baseplate assembly protein
MAEALPTLPAVTFVDAQTVIDTIINSYQQAAGRTLADGDPVRLWCLSMATIIVQLRAENNTAAKNNTLYYARGPFLDHVGFMRRTLRLEAEPARTTLLFALSGSRLVPTIIPAGTRVTADNELYWQTTQALTIAAGQNQGTVPCVAMTAGELGNVVMAGQLTSLVDPVAYVASVTNTTGGQGGRDREEDEAYRYRIYMAPASFSVAGPVDAYKFWAYTAHADITDVLAYSPSPGVAEVRPLLTGGVIPNAAILQAVQDVLSPKDRRPMCDDVQVKAPEPVAYSIAASYYIRREDQAFAEEIAARANQALQGYIAWQRGKLGRDIDPGELNARLRGAGVKRAVITSPVFTALEAWKIAQEDAVTLTAAGVEDE